MDALQQVAADARAEERLDEVRPFVHAEDDHPGPRRVIEDAAHGGRRVAARDLDVQQDDVRLLITGQGDRALAVAGLADHPHVVLLFENAAQSFADQRMVIHEEHRYGLRLAGHRRGPRRLLWAIPSPWACLRLTSRTPLDYRTRGP